MNHLDKIMDFGSLGAVLAFTFWVGVKHILPMWKETTIILGKATDALDEHLHWVRQMNGNLFSKKDHGQKDS